MPTTFVSQGDVAYWSSRADSILPAKSVALPSDLSMSSEMGQRDHPTLGLFLCLSRAGNTVQGKIEVVFVVVL